MTEKEVLAIRGMITGKRGEQTIIAKLYKVSQVCISMIVTRKSWRHI